jgi:hypothetical protein
MSDNDDIERLLREIDGVTGSSGAKPPAPRPDNAPVKPESSGSGQGMALAISAVIGVVGLLLGFLPWVPGLWLGLGGFLGSYIGLTIGRRLG